jgi:hypothetical protein
MKHPDWFDAALENTRRNYKRVDVSKRKCPHCGFAIHVATGWIGEPKQREEMSLRDFRAEVYPFCACAQAMESERLWNLASQTDDFWPRAAAFYHRVIAESDSEQPRQNMLQGYPTWQLSKYIIDPNVEDDFRETDSPDPASRW